MTYHSKQEHRHCVKSVQIQSYFWSLFFCIRNTEKYGPEITPYLDTFHAVRVDLRNLFKVTLNILAYVYSIYITDSQMSEAVKMMF